MSKTWLITGASSGFGRLLAERVASSGDQVIAVARREDRLSDLASKYRGHVTPVALDLTSSQAGPTVVAAVGDAGSLDVLVNNAGYALIGSIEQCDDAAVRAQFDINFFAALTVLRAALPALRASKGRIVQILSFFSQLAVPGSGLYSASKSASTLPADAFGDPNVVIDAVLAVVTHRQPPRRLAVGGDAVDEIRNALQTQVDELAEWEPVGGLTF